MSSICQNFDQPSSLHYTRQSSVQQYALNNVVAHDNNDLLLRRQSSSNYQNCDVTKDENEDARPLKRKITLKSDREKAEFVNKKNRKDFVLVVDKHHDSKKVNYAIVREHCNNDGESINKEFVMCKQNIPQESCSSPTLSTKSLDLEIEHPGHTSESKLKFALDKHKDEELDEQETNYHGHMLHAYHCPKLECKSCFLPFCKDPKEIQKFVEEKLCKQYTTEYSHMAREDAVVQQLVNSIFKINIVHTVNCGNRLECNMPLCKEFDNVLKKLLPEDLADDLFEVLSNIKETDNVKFYQQGVDFQILFDVMLGKGAFGCVSNCWFVDNKGRSSSMAMKRIRFNREQHVSRALGQSLPLMKKLKHCPNVLVPDIVLRSNSEVVMVMEKGEISLFDYMKVHGGVSGLPVDACTYLLFQMAKGLNQIHSAGYTHGDFKVANCVLTNKGRVVKVIDLDSMKEEDVKQQSGSKGYAAPEVFKEKTVIQPSDVYSLCQCIPVLLFGTEKVLQIADRSELLKLICSKDRELADIYEYGTNEDPSKRLTAAQLVQWCRKNVTLKQRWSNYKPLPLPTGPLPHENICHHVIKSYFTALMDDLPRHMQMD